MTTQPSETSLLNQLRSEVTSLNSAYSSVNGQISELKTDIARIQAKIDQLEKQGAIRQGTQSNRPGQVIRGSGSDDEYFNEKEFHRHCMAKALQTHVVDIVEYVPYNSEIPDILAGSNYLNDSEHDMITNTGKNSKAEMRSLVALMRRRSLEAMIAFTNTFEEHRPQLFRAVCSSFESFKLTERAFYSKRRCSACLLVDGVCLSDVVDHLDQKDLLLPKIHLLIVQSNAQIADEKVLWNILFQALTEKDCHKAMIVMIEALEKKGPFFDYIAQSIRKDMREGHNAFHCVCQNSLQRLKFPMKRELDSMSTSSEEFPRSSSSDSSMKTDRTKRRRKSISTTRGVPNARLSVLKQSVAIAKSQRYKSYKRSRATRLFRFKTLKSDGAKPAVAHKQPQRSRRAIKPMELLDKRSSNHALIQWGELRIIAIFVSKLLLRLGRTKKIFYHKT